MPACAHKEAGVLFTTYALLARGGWTKDARGQILAKWANAMQEPVMVFDESHMAKGLLGGKAKKSDDDDDGDESEYDVIAAAAQEVDLDDDDDDEEDNDGFLDDDEDGEGRKKSKGKGLQWKQKEGSKSGLVVLKLQEEVPNARVVYVSATGVSEPRNMVRIKVDFG